jgi:hypothetical protein
MAAVLKHRETRRVSASTRSTFWRRNGLLDPPAPGTGARPVWGSPAAALVCQRAVAVTTVCGVASISRWSLVRRCSVMPHAVKNAIGPCTCSIVPRGDGHVRSQSVPASMAASAAKCMSARPTPVRWASGGDGQFTGTAARRAGAPPARPASAGRGFGFRLPAASRPTRTGIDERRWPTPPRVSRSSGGSSTRPRPRCAVCPTSGC